MTGVFVDTSAWYALENSRDHAHLSAKAIWIKIKKSGIPLITSEWVFVETVALTSKRLGRAASLRIGDAMLSREAVTIYPLETEQRQSAWMRYSEHQIPAGLVDCGSFVLMEELGLTEAFAFDEDFEKAGFKLLEP